MENETEEPTSPTFEAIDSKLDELLDLIKNYGSRINVLENQIEAVQVMIERRVEVEPDREPLKREDYPQWVHDAVARNEIDWQFVVPHRSVEIARNGFNVPFIAGVKMEVPSPWVQDAQERGAAQGDRII